MPSWLTMYEATTDYMSAGDIDPSTNDRTLTVRTVAAEIVEGEKGPQRRAVVHWQEDVKPLIVNKTNTLLLSAMFGDDADNAVGKRVTMRWDPTVKVSGKKVGGLRVKGSPDLDRPMSVEVKLKNRKAKRYNLEKTRGNGPSIEEARAKFLAGAEERHGLSAEQIDAWLTSDDIGTEPLDQQSADNLRAIFRDLPQCKAWHEAQNQPTDTEQPDDGGEYVE